MSLRNMPIVGIGAIIVGLFSAMLAFCMITGTPCSVDGFDEAAYESPEITFRYTVTCVVITIAMALIAVFALLYYRKKWEHPALATAVTILFVFLVAMLYGISDSGETGDQQLLIFASIEFLVAGLIVFKPIVSLIYFAGTFFIFGTALDLSGLYTYDLGKDLIYLAILDIVVCWVVFGLFLRATEREHDISTQAKRDELTGARNRHCLRDDFPTHLGADTFVMLCDIDDFKRYNDEYDHTVGDHLLTQFYFALREAFGDECVYRYGGDEFLVVSPEFGTDEFHKKVHKVCDQLALVKIEGADAKLTYSGGYVQGMASDFEVFREMLHKADENLLEAKRCGKNRIVGE